MAQVAWPGVHLSPMGGGEAPTAQEPQPQPEVTPEATLEETLEVTPAATPADATEDADYVADMAATQSTQDPWPTPAQDTSLPAQDALSSPHDDPTPGQDVCDWFVLV